MRTRKYGKGYLLESIPYQRPDGRKGGLRCSQAEQSALKQLSPKGFMKAGLAALHASLPPSVDEGGPRLTEALHDAIASAARAGALPPAHPARSVALDPGAAPQALPALSAPVLLDRPPCSVLAEIAEALDLPLSPEQQGDPAPLILARIGRWRAGLEWAGDEIRRLRGIGAGQAVPAKALKSGR